LFFYDILIYSKTWADHLRHIRVVLAELHHHALFVKRSKCIFGSPSVAYLGHIISTQGVAMDPAKLQAIHDWPALRSARAMRGFLGLTRYYRKFVQDYGKIVAPLTSLLKEAFSWNDEAQTAFQALKAAVTSAPVLALPDFTKGFIVECDASMHGFGAVLLQEHHPIAYFSRLVANRHRALAVYERELIGLVHAVRHLRPYLWGRAFLVRTDHYSLKFLLDQRLSTIPQHHWVGKLLGFDFSVEYKPGAMNTVADVLSRRDTNTEGSVLAPSAPRFDFVDRLRHAQRQEPALVAIRDELAADTREASWSLLDGMVAYADRLYIPPDSPLLLEVVAATHDDGHEGVQRTLHRLRRDFYFPAMRRVVQDFVRACATCQRNKSDHLHLAGLLLPLPVPQAVWSDVGLDFIEALPRVGGKSMILTVVDRFSKYCHFIPLAHPYSAESVAQAFFTEIVRLHGIPQSMVSDRDSVFTSTFWRELMRLTGPKLHMTSTFHPQSDGQTEAANKVIVMYLRCFTGDRPRQWLRWLPWAEYIYNTAYQSSLKDTPFKVVYGRDPPSIRSYEPGETRVAAVAKTMAAREEFLADVRYRLEQA
jgi:transposase InsO family protein